MSLYWDMLRLKHCGVIQTEKLSKPLDIWKGFLWLISGLKLNLIIMFTEVIVEALYMNAIVRRGHTEKGLKG